MTTMEQAVSQIQREFFTIRAQIASRVHEDAPSPIDVNHRDDAGVGFGSTDGNHNDNDLEFLPTDSNEGRGVRNLELILQHMHETLMTCTSREANDIVATSRKNPLEAWRRLHERCDLSGEGRKENIFRKTPSWNSKRELNAGRLM